MSSSQSIKNLKNCVDSFILLNLFNLINRLRMREMTCTGSLWRPSMRCSRRVTSRISFLRRNWGHLLTPWRRKRPNSMRSCPPPTSIPQHSLLSPGNLRYCKICPNFFYHVLNYKPFSDKFIKLNKKFSLLDCNINIMLNVCVNTPFRGVFYLFGIWVWSVEMIAFWCCF